MASGWIKFLQAYYKKHKASGKSYKQCMVLAGKLWKAQKGKGGGKKGKKAAKDQDDEKKNAPKKRRRRKVRKPEDDSET